MAIPHTSISYYKNHLPAEQGEFGEKGLQNGSSFALCCPGPENLAPKAMEIVYIAKIKPIKAEITY